MPPAVARRTGQADRVAEPIRPRPQRRVSASAAGDSSRRGAPEFRGPSWRPARRSVAAAGVLLLLALSIVVARSAGLADRADATASAAPAAPASQVATAPRPPVASPAADPDQAPGAALPSGSASGQAGGPPEIWKAIVVGLDAARASALATGDASGLELVSLADSAAGRADRLLLADLIRTNRRVRGLRTDVMEVRVVAGSDAHARLLVADQRSGYTIVRADDAAVVQTQPARGLRWWSVELSWTPGGWRTASVAPAAPLSLDPGPALSPSAAAPEPGSRSPSPGLPQASGAPNGTPPP